MPIYHSLLYGVFYEYVGWEYVKIIANTFAGGVASQPEDELGIYHLLQEYLELPSHSLVSVCTKFS